MDKQIEETAKSCTNCIHYEICSLWTTTDLDKDEAYKYCFGHYKPKLPENAVVLTEWEYEYFQKEIRYWQEQYNKESEKFIKFIGETFKEKHDED